MKKILLPLLFACFFLLTARDALAAGPLLKLTPSTKTYSNGETFNVVIGVDSNGLKSQAVDVWMSFDNAKLELLTVEKAANPVFKYDLGDVSIDNAGGRFRTTFMQTDSNTFEIKALNGDLAVMTFKAKALGTAKVDFICTPGESTESNINDESFFDVINCAQNINGVYTIVAGSSNNDTPATTTETPPTSSSETTPTNTNTNANTTTELPKTGVVENTIMLMVVGVIGVLSSLALRKL